MPNPSSNDQPHIVVLDIETKESFAEVGRGGIDKLTVSLVGIWSSVHDFKSYEEHELDELWPILESADRIIGFNIIFFDFPILSRYYKGDIKSLPVLDLLTDVQKQLGFRLKLDHLVEHNLGQKKIADGLAAIEFFRNGELEKLKEYCLDDVRLTRDLYDHGVKNGRLKYIDRFRGLSELAVSWKPEVKTDPAVNLTLPF